jgi:hypothetical protein
MNEDMQAAWLEISQMLGEPTRAEFDVFLRTWQRAVQATRRTLAEQSAQSDIRNATLDEIAGKIALMPFGDTAASFAVWIKEQKT